MKLQIYSMLLLAGTLAGILALQVLVRADDVEHPAERTKLAVVWTSGDPEVAEKVCFMYTQAAKKASWFDEVVLIVWGPSSRLLAADKELQANVKGMQASGVVVQACVVCADMYGVADDLRQMGIEVKPMGKPLSEMLKTDWKVLTF
jgi:hypothetical protein